MKRLCALLGFICFFVLAAVFYFGETFMWAVLICAGLLLTVSLIIPKTRREKILPVAALLAIMISLWLVSYTAFFVTDVQEKFDGREGSITAVQKSLSYFENGYYCYEMDIKSIDGEAVNAGALIMTDEPFYSDPCDEVTFEAELIAEHRASYLGKGIKFTSYVFGADYAKVKSPEVEPPLYYISELNLGLETGLYTELDFETANFSSALLLGNTHQLEKDVVSLFRSSGVSHIVVVSGLHLSIITALITKLMKKTVKNRYISSGVIILAIITFAAMTGFGYSVVRAMIVQIVIALGGVFRRRADPLNSLGLAALIIILPNPYAAADVGFQLSLLSTLGIVTLSDKMYAPVMKKLSAYRVCNIRPINMILKVIFSTFFTSLSASLMTLPITALVFGGFGTVAVFVNILIVPLVTPALILAALTSFFHYVEFFPLLADTAAFLLELIYKIIIWMCETFSALPYSYIRTDDIYFTLWIGATLILAGVAIAIGKRRAYIMTVFISLIILTACAGVFKLSHRDVLTLIIPDTGGKSVILQSSEGHCVLSLGGSERKSHKLISELEKLPFSNGNIIISQGDSTADIYLRNILYEFDYKTVLRYDSGRAEAPVLSEEQGVISFTEDYRISLWNKAELFVFSEDDLIYEYIEAENVSVLILPEGGDALKIPEKFRNPEIIITESIIDHAGTLSCDTLVVIGDDYMAEATASILSGIAKEVVLDSEMVYDINQKSEW